MAVSISNYVMTTYQNFQSTWNVTILNYRIFCSSVWKQQTLGSKVNTSHDIYLSYHIQQNVLDSTKKLMGFSYFFGKRY